ncbi:MAG: thioredoxin family protein [Gammaproteobacteria bacterium HGW-Gammaproteobacteria-3]|nr:MAG: thioredoxin family protein [Gammaproteobacteria bacterium HGW-Gammaproteobacteria-3]
MDKLLLFGTQGCHLCEQAEALINGYEVTDTGLPSIEKIDIAEQDQWQERYAVRIPVLYHAQTGEELGWPFDRAGLDAFIKSIRAARI